MRRLLVLLLAIIAWPAAAAPPIVLAAASLQESLNAAATAWARQHHARPTLSFAASSALARQIDAGAPADLFISADEPWMDDVQKHGLLKAGTRVSFLANELVLIQPALSPAEHLKIGPGFPLAKMLGSGRLAMAEVSSVPAGKYGKEALTKLGIWDQVSSKVVSGDSVRAALTLVERQEVPYGIVYLTDALASKNVRIVGNFPADSHAPITYPVAMLTASTSPDADGFRRFLLSKPGTAIFKQYGFQPK